jgi:hypothetical protein
MPKQYERIRDSYIAKGKSPDKAKEIAARTYISEGKTKAAKSMRAKSLHHK